LSGQVEAGSMKNSAQVDVDPGSGGSIGWRTLGMADCHHPPSTLPRILS